MTTNIPEGVTNPPIDDLLDKVDSKYRLVLFAAKRARQINAYYSQLGEGLLENVGPLVETGVQEKPLSIALREIEADVLECAEIDPEAEAAARAEAAAEPGEEHQRMEALGRREVGAAADELGQQRQRLPDMRGNLLAALEVLAPLPDSDAKAALLALAESVVTRAG